MEMKQHTLNQWIKEKITREIRKYLEMNENEKHNIPKLMGHDKIDTKGNL